MSKAKKNRVNGVKTVDLSGIDPKLIVPSYISKPDVIFHDVDESPFKVYGIGRYGDRYMRVPPSFAEGLNSRAKKFSSATAGARVRFKTDSSYVAVRVHVGEIYRVPMLTLTASAGLDLYEGNKFLGSFNPPYELQSGGVYESVINLDGEGMKDLTVNLPLYSGVNRLWIGVSKKARIHAPNEYKREAPIAFYGSSVTHGACASRPGNTFSAIISRSLDSDIINLGFGAGCRAETKLAEYIGGLGASILICGYDHNAPNVEKLLATHRPFYEAVRLANADMPILFVSRPEIYSTEDGESRRKVIKKTVEFAKEIGDKNVYYLDGRSLLCDSDMTHDLIHPNDLGQAEIAGNIIEKLEEIFKI